MPASAWPRGYCGNAEQIMEMQAAPETLDAFESGEAMPDDELLSILGQHEAQAIGYEPGGDDEISSSQETALDYYNGIMDDVPAEEGGSSVVDGTVALVVDNALASILKPFVSSDETVVFSPRGPEDVKTAEQATEYVNYVFNIDNPGFVIMSSWFKDALLSKLGVVKVWWEDQPRLEAEQIVLEDELIAEMVRADPNYLGEEGGVAAVGKMVPDGRVKVVNIPPEEFRISSMSRSVEEANYTAHVPANMTRSDLLELGFDPEIIDELPTYTSSVSDNTLRQARFDDENVTDGSIDAPQRSNDRMAFRDEYVRLDYDGDGIAELRRIMRVGDVILFNDEVDESPFASLCPIPMPHKVYGHSLADRALQEQRIGTVLWRQMLDNLYKSNNPRPIVGEGGERADGSTGDSLEDNTPGAAVMVRDMSQFQLSDAVKFTAHQTYPMMELLDKKVEENTGISRAGQGLDTNTLRKSGQTTATEMSMIQSGKNARSEMIARTFAETGVSRLFKLILGLVTKHQPRKRIIRLRSDWVPMDPRGWPEMDVKISVGLGMGDKTEQMFQSDSVLQTMAELEQTPYSGLIDAQKVYNAVKRKFNAAGIKNVDDFLNEPQEGGEGEQPQEPSPDQMQAQAEAQRLQSEQQMQQAKLVGEQQIATQRLENQREEAAVKQDLARQQAEFDANLAREKAKFEAELALQKLNMEQSLAERRMQMSEREGEHKMSSNRPGGDLDK